MPVSLTPTLPRFAQIEPIGRCNLACRMCTVNERGDTVAELSIERFAELLAQMPGLEELHLQGLGEPMLHPRFFEMVEMASARGIRVSTNTNLTLLTALRARRCVTSGLASISVSLDGASAAVYESIRHKASFAKVLRNLGRLVDARDAAGSALEVRAVMVLMRVNLDELPALLRLLHAHRVHELLVQRLSSDLAQPQLPERYIPIRHYVDAAELRSADLEHAGAVFDAARQLAVELGIDLHLPRLQPRAAPIERPDGPRCRWPWDQLYLTAAGEMLPCCMVATADRASFGNVFEAVGAGTGVGVGVDHGTGAAGTGASAAPSSIEAAGGLAARWHGARAQAFRAALADDEPPAVCRSCALYRGTF